MQGLRLAVEHGISAIEGDNGTTRDREVKAQHQERADIKVDAEKGLIEGWKESLE